MDPLSDVLTQMRPTGYGFRGLDAAGDWALSFPSAKGLRCFAIEQGSCWLRLGKDDKPMRLEQGNVVLLSGGGAASLYSCEKTTPIDSVAFLTTVPAGQVATLNGGGECRGIGGFFGLAAASDANWLFDALPHVVHVRTSVSRMALYAGIERLMAELIDPRPGADLLASHLAQALLVEALRAHLEDAPPSRGWLGALAVPTLRRALSAMHADVARNWTLNDLAEVANMSRSSFATHFERATGDTPIAYLTRWRMTLAMHQLQSSRMSLSEIAARVGYQSESAFGAAFKRVIGRSPRQTRNTQTG